MRQRRHTQKNNLYDLKKELESAKRKYIAETANLIRNSLIIEELEPLCNTWSGGRAVKQRAWHRAHTIKGYSRSIDVHLYLASTDTIGSLFSFFEAIDSKYPCTFTLPNPKTHQVTFYFTVDTLLNIEVYVHFKSSTTCKTIPIGKLIEETKIQCIYI